MEKSKYIVMIKEQYVKIVTFIIPVLALAGTITILLATFINNNLPSKTLTVEQFLALIPKNSLLRNDTFCYVLSATLFFIVVTPLVLELKELKGTQSNVDDYFSVALLIIAPFSLYFTIYGVLGAVIVGEKSVMIISLFIFVFCALILSRKMLRIIVRKIKK